MTQVGNLQTGGLLIVNADDLGRDQRTTNRIIECVGSGSVSAASAMVYMSDSERASGLLAQVEVGLHLNFTTPFSASNVPRRLLEHQQRLARYLLAHRLSQLVFNPRLVRPFDFVVKAQLDEFRRIYGADPLKIDGHHHLHLSANVLLQGLLPPGVLVRRNFHFEQGEKGVLNRAYRTSVDWLLARRHRLVDFFFALPPAGDRHRLRRIRELAKRFVVEVEVHPVEQHEHDSLQALNDAEASTMAPAASPADVRAWVRGAA
jgi:chitin disaccharide deacetylase